MPFQKGNRANPGGRPKEKEFLSMLRLAVKELGSTGKPKLREIAEKAVALALEGESWAVQFVADRLDGKPAQTIDATFSERQPNDMSDAELLDAIRTELRERALQKGNGSSVAH